MHLFINYFDIFMYLNNLLFIPYWFIYLLIYLYLYLFPIFYLFFASSLSILNNIKSYSKSKKRWQKKIMFLQSHDIDSGAYKILFYWYFHHKKTFQIHISEQLILNVHLTKKLNPGQKPFIWTKNKRKKKRGGTQQQQKYANNFDHDHEDDLMAFVFLAIVCHLQYCINTQ